MPKLHTTQTVIPFVPIGQESAIEHHMVDLAVAEYLKGNPVRFAEYLHHRHWERFAQSIGSQSGWVWLEAPLPQDWTRPSGCEIRVWNSVLHRIAGDFVQNAPRRRVEHRRQALSLSHDFILTYGTWQAERESMVQHLERLGVLDQSWYSRPSPTTHSLHQHLPDQPFEIRSRQPARRLPETVAQSAESQRFNHARNWQDLMPVARQCHCWAVLENFCLNDDLLGPLTEKILYPMFLGIPFILIGNQHHRTQMQDWGIEPAEISRTTARSVAEQMLWLRQIFHDPDLAQQWQELQGERISHNLHHLNRLAHTPRPQWTQS